MLSNAVTYVPHKLLFLPLLLAIRLVSKQYRTLYTMFHHSVLGTGSGHILGPLTRLKSCNVLGAVWPQHKCVINIGVTFIFRVMLYLKGSPQNGL
jgi:hypothetical protein